jgi:hypothetical protein
MSEKRREFVTKAGNVTREVRQQTVSYITGGLGLVAGLAWNEAIKGLIDYWFPLKGNSVLAKFIYALIITLIVVLTTIYLLRVFRKKETE